MQMTLSNLKASHLLNLSILAVSLVGVNSLMCKTALAGELNQNDQATVSQVSLSAENTDIIYAKAISKDNVESLNSAVSIPESSPSIIPFLTVGALFLTYKKNR